MDQALKQRLVGASILIALAVIFVPMLLDDPVQEPGAASLEIPPRPQAPVHTRRIPAQPGEAGDSLSAQNEPSNASSSNSAKDDGLGIETARPRLTDAATQRPARYPAANGSDLYSPDAYLGATDTSTGRNTTGRNANDRSPSTKSEAGSEPAASQRQREYSNDNTRVDPTGLGSLGQAQQERKKPAKPTTESAPESTRDKAPTSAAAASTSAARNSNSTLIENSPPVAANPAASLITPNESGPSGLIPDDQWALQVASFSATENASRLARQLREMGYNPNLDTIFRGGAALHRVRVGPFTNRQSAAAAGERIGAEISGLRPSPVAPRVGDTPDPEQATLASQTRNSTAGTKPVAKETKAATSVAPSKRDDGLDRYAVQLGSFSAPDNADRLQTRVREAGYSAFVERVDGANGIRFLVKVGPLLSRSDASATRDRIERELGMKGILVDYF